MRQVNLDYLANKELRLLTYDMMLAWEASDTESESLSNVRHLHLLQTAYLVRHPHLLQIAYLQAVLNYYLTFSSSDNI